MRHAFVAEIWAIPPHPISTTIMSPVNPPSTRIRKCRAPQRPPADPDPHQTPSGMQHIFMIAKILTLDSIVQTKLPDTIKAAVSPRATTNRSQNFTASWSDLICESANY
jgi:hypothetical protein